MSQRRKTAEGLSINLSAKLIESDPCVCFSCRFTVYVGDLGGSLYAIGTDHTKSSSGSRARLGTLGHPSERSMTDEPTTTATDEPTPTASPTPTPTDELTTTEGSTATSTDAPGFGLGTVATALGTGLGLARVVSRVAGDDETGQSDAN